VAQALWRRVLENVEGEIDSSSLRVWFESVTAVTLESDSLTLSVPNPFAKEYIETRFEATLETALREELSEQATLRVVVGA
jgi:chromosomal replication initiator protein